MTIAYDRRGEGDPMVLLHGIGSRWQVWEPVFDELAAHHDVIALDLPGFGASPHDGTAPTIEGQADRVERFFGELGIDHPHVVGWSMGGGIALELARRSAVRSMTAISPVGFWTARELAFAQRSLRASRALLPMLRPVVPSLVRAAPARVLLFGQYFGRPWRLTPDECIQTIDALMGASAFEPCLTAFERYRFARGDELRGVPVTVAWGTRDFLLLHRQAKRARRMLPWAQHVDLAGCGHGPFADDPELVARVLLDGAAA